MLRWRLIAAAGILVPFLGLLYLDDQWNFGRPGVWLLGLAVIASGLAADELNHLLLSSRLATSARPNLVAVLATTLLTCAPLVWRTYPTDCPVGRWGWTLIGAVGGLAVIFGRELLRYREPGESIQRLAGGGLAIAYCGLLMGCLMQLRLVAPARVGWTAIISTILIVKMSDAGAYFIGRRWGRTKLIRVSPGKTVEGVLGGLLFALVAGALTRGLLVPQFAPQVALGTWSSYLAYAACLMAAGLWGDLAESLLKRDAGQKDSSRWMPGLGGVLDVLDSLLAAAPVSLLWWVSGWLVQ